MKTRSKVFLDTNNSLKMRVSAKVWKVQIKFPCGFCLKENIENVKSAKWAFVQVLN